MRLIDADELMKDRVENDPVVIAAKCAPTAYDVDKVGERLAACRKIMESPVQTECWGEECRSGDCTVCAFEKAIEIVKSGGIE